MTYRASTNLVTLKSGKTVQLNGSLIHGARRPPGGWRAKFTINGVDREFRDLSVQGVANQVIRWHAANGVPLDRTDMWLNMNLQWMNMLDEKYFIATKAALTALISGAQDQGSVLKKVYPPEVWGSIAWKWLGLFLAQENYKPEDFLTELERVLFMLGDGTLGCPVCFAEFSNFLQRIRLNMPQTREDARKWLWETHDAVSARIGKPRINFDRAKQLNFWS